jgi:tetratricopeptide (TPR) repeat protein
LIDLKLDFTDPKLLELYRQVIEEIGEERLQAYDRSIPTIDYEKTTAGSGTVKPDGILQSYELFQAIIQEPQLHDVYKRFTGQPLPWLASNNKLNRQLFARFDKLVREWRETNSEKDPHDVELAQEIFQWVTKAKEHGGMGMAQHISYPESTFDEAVSTTHADCTEIYYILDVFFKRAGFLVRPEFVRVDPSGKTILHVVAALTIGQRTYLVDPLFHSFNAQHREHTPMSYRQLLGFAWINRSALETRKNRFMNRANEFLTRAQWIDPQNPFVFLSWAWRYSAQEPPDFDKARQAMERAEQIAPKFGETYGHWGFYFDQRGNFKKAIEYYRKSLQAEPRETKTRIQLVQALACDGQEKSAQQELQILYDSYGDQWSLDEQQEYQRLKNWLTHQIETKSCGKAKQETSRKGKSISLGSLPSHDHGG